MGGDIWKSLFEWSMQHQQPSAQPRAMSEEDQKWLDAALRSAMVDLGQRMHSIKDMLDNAGADSRPAAALKEKEALLDELMEIVDSIDHARDLQTIGGLQTLLSLLESPHASLRWRAAEVLATCAQNNPPVQQSFMEGGLMPRLEVLLQDGDATVRTKALLALSCMMRGYRPALVLFRQEGGLQSLLQLLKQDEVRQQRKCLQILQYFICNIPQDRQAACDGGVLPALCTCLASEDSDVRQAALGLAGEIAKDPGCLREMQQDADLKQQLELLQVRLDALPQSEWGSVQDEVDALKHLTAALEQVVLSAVAGDIARRAAAVQDPSVTGAAPSALQIVAVGSGSGAPAGEGAAGSH